MRFYDHESVLSSLLVGLLLCCVIYPFFLAEKKPGLFCAAVAGQFLAQCFQQSCHGVLFILTLGLTGWCNSEIPNNQPPGMYIRPEFFLTGEKTTVYQLSFPQLDVWSINSVAPDQQPFMEFSQLISSTDLRWISWSQALRARVGGTWTFPRMSALMKAVFSLVEFPL